MTVVISYLARDGEDLRSDHAENVQYDMETIYSSFSPTKPKIIRKDQKALTGRVVSIFHRAERYYTFNLKHADIDTLADWREFSDSTRYGASSPFAIDASTVVGVNSILENLIMIDAPVLNLSKTRNHFSVTFKCYRQPQ